MPTQSIAKIIVLFGLGLTAIARYIRAWAKPRPVWTKAFQEQVDNIRREHDMQKVYFPLQFPMEELQEFAKQHNCTLYRTYANEYNVIPNPTAEPKQDTALGSSKVVPLHRHRHQPRADT